MAVHKHLYTTVWEIMDFCNKHYSQVEIILEILATGLQLPVV